MSDEPITESLLRRAIENIGAGFAIGLVAIVALVVLKYIDSSTFGTCFTALIIAFMGALTFRK